MMLTALQTQFSPLLLNKFIIVIIKASKLRLSGSSKKHKQKPLTIQNNIATHVDDAEDDSQKSSFCIVHI